MSEHAVPQLRHHRVSLRSTALLVLLVAAAIAASAWYVANRSSGTSASAGSPTGAVTATPAGLRATAKALGHPIYWAGAQANMTYELTVTKSGQVYVRYLPAGVKAGDARPKFLTVGTYPKANAYSVLSAARKITTARVQTYGNDTIAVSYANRPTSVYVAHRGVASMIEVFSPKALGAETLVRAGLIVPVG